MSEKKKSICHKNVIVEKYQNYCTMYQVYKDELAIFTSGIFVNSSFISLIQVNGYYW